MHDQQILCFDILAANPLVYPQASSPNNYQEAGKSQKEEDKSGWGEQTFHSMNICSVGCVVSREYVIFVCQLFALFCPSALLWPMIATQATNKLCGAEQRTAVPQQWPAAPDPRPVVSSLVYSVVQCCHFVSLTSNSQLQFGQGCHGMTTKPLLTTPTQQVKVQNSKVLLHIPNPLARRRF